MMAFKASSGHHEVSPTNVFIFLTPSCDKCIPLCTVRRTDGGKFNSLDKKNAVNKQSIRALQVRIFPFTKAFQPVLTGLMISRGILDKPG